MRIVYLHQYFKTPSMAGGTRSYEMARRLVQWGHEVHMVSAKDESADPGAPSEEVIDGIHVHWLPVDYSNKLGFAARLIAFFKFAWLSARKAASLPGDVVFATSTPLTIALPGAWAARRHKVPMVFEVRDLWPAVPVALGVLRHPLSVKAAQWLERFAYRHSARIVALAPGMADGVEEAGYPREKIAIIPNGCDRALFNDAQPGFSVGCDDTRWVLYIGTIGPANGVDYIVRLARALLDTNPTAQIKFNIIGDGKELASVQKLAEDLGVLDTSVFFRGSVLKRDIPNWMAQCRATIMTYDGPEVLYRDSVSNKFFDSMAAGKPVVANFAGFSTLVAQSCGAGVILPKADLAAAARQLTRTLYDDAYLHEAEQSCLRLASDVFDREKLARDLETVLLEAQRQESVERQGLIGQQFRALWEQVKGFHND